MNNKCIWYISKYVGISNEGVRTRHYYFSKYFALEGYDVQLITSNSTPKYRKFEGLYQTSIIDGFNYILINGIKVDLGFSLKRIFSWLQFEFNLYRFISKRKIKNPDIVIVSSLSLLTILNGYLLKKKYKAKLIFEVRDIWPLSLIDIGGYSKYNPLVILLKLIEKFAYKNADIVVGTMPRLIDHVKETIEKEIKVEYIPMGFDEEDLIGFKELPYEVFQKINHEHFKIGYAGSIGSANQIEQIIDVAILLKNYSDIHFYILGDGPKRNEFEEKIKELSLKNITFLGKIKRDCVNSFLTNCDVLINPWKNSKIYRFGVSPNKWIDYMLSSRPIIVPYSGFRNIINEADCGSFIEAENPKLFAEKIIEYYKLESTELDKIGQKGKMFLNSNLNYKTLTLNYINIFKQC